MGNNQKGNALILGIVGVLVTLGLFGAYYYGTQKRFESPKSQTIEVNNLSPIPQATPHASPSNNFASWKTYINNKYKYSIAYPSTYSIATYPELKAVTVSGSEQYIGFYKYSEKDAQANKSDTEYEQNLYYDSYRVSVEPGECDKKSMQDLTGVLTTEIQVGGETAYKFSRVPSQYEEVQVYITRGSDCFYIQFYIDPGAKIGSDQLLNKILAAFKFID
jgi:hypothetical protein